MDGSPRRRIVRIALALGLLAIVTSPVSLALDLRIDAPRDLVPGTSSLPLQAARELAAPHHDVHAHVGVEPAHASTMWHSLTDAPDQPMTYVCPNATLMDQVHNTNTDRTVHATCPYRIYDYSYPFGSPALTMHPDHQDEMAFFALHGNPVPPEDEAPTDRSRKGSNLHTTFTTSNAGMRWTDNPTCCGLPSSNALAEFATGTMDSAGMVYIGFLWSLHDGISDEYIGNRSGSMIGLYKAANVHQDLTPVYGNPEYFKNRSREGIIPELHVVRVPVPTPGADDREAANETQDNTTTAGNDGEVTIDTIPLNETVVAIWGETTDNLTTAPNGWFGWIEAAWTHTGSENEWTRLADEELIGPCKEFSNAAVYRGRVYVACNVAKGYEARPRARVGDVDIWSIDVRTGTSRLESFTGLCCGRSHIAMTDEGYMFLTVSTFDQDSNRFHASLQYGWRGQYWHTDGRSDYGMLLNDLASRSSPLRDAHITGVAIAKDTNTAFFVYQEWVNETGDPFEDFDPLDPPRLTGFRKIIVAANECRGAIAYASVELGYGLDPYNYQAYGVNPGAFNDIQDGLQMARVPGGKEIMFFLINDHGVGLFGGIDPFFQEEPCSPLPPPPLIPPVAGIAAPIAQGVNTLMGATFGVAAVSMIGYLLTVKRRNPNWTTVEDER